MIGYVRDLSQQLFKFDMFCALLVSTPVVASCTVCVICLNTCCSVPYRVRDLSVRQISSYVVNLLR
jgi:hypothetical protein